MGVKETAAVKFSRGLPEFMASVAAAARHSSRSEPKLVISEVVTGYSQNSGSMSIPKNPYLASLIEELMKDCRKADWLAIAVKTD